MEYIKYKYSSQFDSSLNSNSNSSNSITKSKIQQIIEKQILKCYKILTEFNKFNTLTEINSFQLLTFDILIEDNMDKVYILDIHNSLEKKNTFIIPNTIDCINYFNCKLR